MSFLSESDSIHRNNCGRDDDQDRERETDRAQTPAQAGRRLTAARGGLAGSRPLARPAREQQQREGQDHHEETTTTAEALPML